MQHEALAASCEDLVEQALQRGAVGHAPLRDRLHPRRAGRVGQAAQACQPGVEVAWGAGQLEEHVAHLAPQRILGILAAQQPGERVEAAAAEPELAVERDRWQRGEEPGRRRQCAPAAKAQHAAVPRGAHAVELLAHPPARGVDGGVVAQGEHGRGCCGCCGNCRCVDGRGGLCERAGRKQGEGQDQAADGRRRPAQGRCGNAGGRSHERTSCPGTGGGAPASPTQSGLAAEPRTGEERPAPALASSSTSKA